MINKQSMKSIFVVWALCMLVVGILFARHKLTAFAEGATGKEYTDVLADLQADEAFDAAGYPENASDHSIQVVQMRKA